MWQLKTIESPTIAVRCSASCGLLNPIEKGIARALEMQFRIHNYLKSRFLFSHFRETLFLAYVLVRNIEEKSNDGAIDYKILQYL